MELESSKSVFFSKLESTWISGAFPYNHREVVAAFPGAVMGIGFQSGDTPQTLDASFRGKILWKWFWMDDLDWFGGNPIVGYFYGNHDRLR